MNPSTLSNYRYQISAIFVFVAALCFSHIHQGTLAVDAIRYSQIARNILVTDDWVELLDSYTNVQYTAKPPLLFWILAVFFKLFGFSTFIAKLPSLIFTFIALVLLWRTANQLFGGKAAALSLLLFSVNQTFMKDVADLNLEGIILCGTMICIMSFLKAVLSDARQFTPWLHFGLGLLLLSQSKPPYIGFVLFSCFMPLVFERSRWHIFYNVRMYIALAIPAIVSLFWFFLIADEDYRVAAFDNQVSEPLRFPYSIWRNILYWLPDYFLAFFPLSIIGIIFIIRFFKVHGFAKFSFLDRFLLFWIVPLIPICIFIESRPRYILLPMLGLALFTGRELGSYLTRLTDQYLRRFMVFAAAACFVLFPTNVVTVHRADPIILAIRQHSELIDGTLFCVDGGKSHHHPRAKLHTRLLAELEFNKTIAVYNSMNLPDEALNGSIKVLAEGRCLSNLKNLQFTINEHSNFGKTTLISITSTVIALKPN